QRGLGGIALQEHGEIQYAEQARVHIVHLGIAGEKDESAPAGNFQQAPDTIGGLGGELRRAGVGKIRRSVEQCLAFVVEMRWQHAFPRVIQPQPPTHVFKAAAHGQCRRSQHRAFQLVEQADFQNGRYIDGSGLQENILFVAAAAPALDPENGVAVLGLHQEAELHLQLLRAAGEVEDFLRLGGQVLQFRTQTGKRLLQPQKLVAILFHEFAPVFEREASVARGQQREEEHSPLAHALQRARKRGRKHVVALQGNLDVPAQLFESSVAHGNSEIASRDVFQFMGFVENYGSRLRENSGIGRILSLLLDRQVSKKKVVVDDDDVALHRLAMHLGNEAAVPGAALLSQASIGAGIDLVPEGAGLGKRCQFGPVAGIRHFFPGGNGAVVLDLLESAEHGLIGQVVELLAAQIVVASLHVTGLQLAFAAGEERLLEKRDVFEEELFLQI